MRMIVVRVHEYSIRMMKRQLQTKSYIAYMAEPPGSIHRILGAGNVWDVA